MRIINVVFGVIIDSYGGRILKGKTGGILPSEEFGRFVGGGTGGDSGGWFGCLRVVAVIDLGIDKGSTKTKRNSKNYGEG